MDPNWLTAIAAIIQVFIGLVLGGLSLYYLKKYVEETTRLRIEAEAQSEAQISPVLLIDFTQIQNIGNVAEIRNCGRSPAFEIQIEDVIDKQGHIRTFRLSSLWSQVNRR